MSKYTVQQYKITQRQNSITSMMLNNDNFYSTGPFLLSNQGLRPQNLASHFLLGRPVAVGGKCKPIRLLSGAVRLHAPTVQLPQRTAYLILYAETPAVTWHLSPRHSKQQQNMHSGTVFTDNDLPHNRQHSDHRLTFWRRCFFNCFIQLLFHCLMKTSSD